MAIHGNYILRALCGQEIPSVSQAAEAAHLYKLSFEAKKSVLLPCPHTVCAVKKVFLQLPVYCRIDGYCGLKECTLTEPFS